MKYDFLKEETFGLRVQDTFIGKSCEMFIPTDFLDPNDPNALAVDLGNRIETEGIFWFRVNGKDWYELQLPLKFQFQFSDSHKITARIKPGMPDIEYMVYLLKYGDAFVYDVNHKEALNDFKVDFMSKIIEGTKMPKYIAYNDVLGVFQNAMLATGVTKLGVDFVTIEFMLSELYRDKHNMIDPFRLAYTGRNDYDYRMVRLTKIPALNSEFTSLTGEDINQQLVSSILRTREKLPDRITPIEEVIKY